MKKYIQITFVAMLLLLATATASAQKFGYVNSAEILAAMPAMKAAESNLEGLQKQLQKKGQGMVENFQKDLQTLQGQAAAGELTPKQQQEESAKLEARQEEIAQFEQKMIADLQEKRAALLKPIYDEINAAIEAVAKEGGYQFIFDKQVLLFGQEAANVGGQVKAKLGI